MDIVAFIFNILRVLIIVAEALGVFVDPMISEAINYIADNSKYISLTIHEIYLWLCSHF